MDERKRILDKIKKCLALARSSNEHEAATALRQAQKLMQEYGVTDTDVLAHQASEARAKASAKSTPAAWENYLVQIVATAFGCRTLFAEDWNEGHWIFIGCGAAPEVAQYAVTVLMRQLKKQRSEFIRSPACKRLKAASKTRRADLFCDAWVGQVHQQVRAFSGASQDETNRSAIAAYMAQKYPTVGSLQSRNRNDGRDPRGNDWNAIHAGRQAGKNAQLNHGVSGTQQQALR